MRDGPIVGSCSRRQCDSLRQRQAPRENGGDHADSASSHSRICCCGRYRRRGRAPRRRRARDRACRAWRARYRVPTSGGRHGGRASRGACAPGRRRGMVDRARRHAWVQPAPSVASVTRFARESRSLRPPGRGREDTGGFRGVFYAELIALSGDAGAKTTSRATTLRWSLPKMPAFWDVRHAAGSRALRRPQQRRWIPACGETQSVSIALAPTARRSRTDASLGLRAPHVVLAPDDSVLFCLHHPPRAQLGLLERARDQITCASSQRGSSGTVLRTVATLRRSRAGDARQCDDRQRNRLVAAVLLEP